MTKRERKWLKAKREERNRRRFFREAKKRAFRSFFECNMMGSRVFLNEAGNVEYKILTTDELLDLKIRLDSGEILPDDTTIYAD
jgi:hypothetical protein